MARRRAAKKRPDQPDARFLDHVFGKFINVLMEEGKKSVAESIFYRALEYIEEKNAGADAKQMFHDAIANVKPSFEVRSRRVGGATYQVPIPVSPFRSRSLSIRWLIQAARERSERSMERRLALEIMDAEKKTGAAIRKRENTHKMAEANKAFSHFRW
ncbi:30S ribosomal protein S7 [Candidatus Hydrogenosomobacter endosymbioticus]|uniref:Small ribosomal subunit protein uS7 n=1 Tax=Candidatus Hydrogenosomobacter endosymbioticus TaxID=2558174 RepID=A0ABM7V812_9PROT|nr:30S ribosomal protein S7 [Candidatus Hydrogenosomobacter endosymbioticus]BDB95901.1 30S ribosomal protein S7 [Candidatus Hydrogenosomobacter endosymbioticus]